MCEPEGWSGRGSSCADGPQRVAGFVPGCIARGCGTARRPLPASTGDVPVLVPRWRNNGSREAAVLWQRRALNLQFIPLEVRLFDLMYNGSHV